MSHSSRIIVPVAALSAVLLAACAGLKSGTNGNNNTNGNPDASMCGVVLTFDPPDPQENDRISITMSMTTGTPTNITWTVRDPASAPVAVTLRNNDRTAEFVPADPGTYTVTVNVQTADVGYCSGYDSVTVQAQNARVENMYLVLTPADLDQAPRQQRTIQVVGQTPQSNLEYQLDPGITVDIHLEGPDGPMAGYVRLTPAGSGLHQEGFHTPPEALQFRLFDPATYDVLVVPETANVAPAAMTGLTVTELGQGSTFTFTRGEPVTGHVLDDTAQSVPDSRVVLRCDDVPSAVGVTGIISGYFELFARPGACMVSVVPQEGSQWPEINVPLPAGVQVAAGGSLSLDFAYKSLSFRQFAGQLSEVDGQTPVPGARISIMSETVADVADLIVTVDASPIGPVVVSGSFRSTALTDGSGTFNFSAVPAGVYRVVIEPPSGPATVIDATDLTAGDVTGETLRLVSPAVLYGLVRGEPEVAGSPEEPVPDVRVIAVTDLGTGSTEQTLTDDTGYFELSVVRGGRYTLTLAPDPFAGFSWMTGYTVDATANQVEFRPDNRNIVLTRALRLEGEVVGPGSGAGVLLQVLCQGCGHRTPLAETFTDVSRGFTLSVPDPGLEE